ncbi:MAG: trans-aconitate methyltransferase [Bradymonadia bacterium]|jgi:trans-aconitate methyltransferase
MKRTPEPELMDDDAQALAYAHADFSASDQRFVDTFVARFGNEFAGEVVDLGCGPGNIAIPLAKALPHCMIRAVDGSEAMMAHGRDRCAKEGVDRVEFERHFLPTDALPSQHFVAIVSNSLLHHLHDPQGLWSTIRRCAAPGAPVFVADLRRPATAEDALRLTEETAADAPPVLRDDFHASLHAAFEAQEVRAQLNIAGLTDLDVVEIGDRHLYIIGRMPE